MFNGSRPFCLQRWSARVIVVIGPNKQEAEKK